MGAAPLILRRWNIRFVRQPGDPRTLGYSLSLWRRDKNGTLVDRNFRTRREAFEQIRAWRRADKRGRMISISRLMPH